MKAKILFSSLLLAGLATTTQAQREKADVGFIQQAANEVSCNAKPTLAERLLFADAGTTYILLGRTDDWARQLSAFERSARRRTLDPVTTRELLHHAGLQGVHWSAEREAQWQGVADELNTAVLGLNVRLPHVFVSQTTGLEEFNAAYSRNDAIVLPKERADLFGQLGPRSDFFLLAHELWHLLSWEDDKLRDAAYALLGFEEFKGIEPPVELEGRRLSNPGGHTYEHALRLEESPDGPVDVVPFIRSTASLEEVIQLPTAGPPAIFGVLEILLLPVDTANNELVRGANGELVTYNFGNTSWVPQTLLNTNFIIHPEEIMADNFALLMEWRATGMLPATTPGGFPVNDIQLLEDFEDVLTEGCVLAQFAQNRP